jgi:tRNA threonylcarbamoyladenosine biosynthesis protein TsaE
VKSLSVVLSDARATEELGRAMAASLSSRPGFALLLEGDLGAGKTTLVRGLVGALPGAHAAEVASPSFTICNLYPTEPAIAHYDLYRLEGQAPGDDLLDDLETVDTLVIVEWAQYLVGPGRPEERVECLLSSREKGRKAVFRAQGQKAEGFLDSLARKLVAMSVPFQSPTGDDT